MKKIFTKTAILLVFLLSVIAKTYGQWSYGIPFTFAASTPSIAAVTSVNIILSLRPAAVQDEFDTLITPGGFSFNFAGINYTKFIVSSNGWMALTNGAVIPATIPSPLPNNSLSTYTGGLPLIAPLWDDHNCGVIQYGIVANVLTVKWTLKWDKTNAGAYTALTWVTLNGNTGVITMNYSIPAYVPTNPSASIGIAGICTGDFYSVTPNITVTSSTVDSVTENTSINAKPNNAAFTFTPYPVPYDNCAGAINLGALTTTCTPQIYSNINATTSGSNLACSPGGTDNKDVWFYVIKPFGVTDVRFTTSAVACTPNLTGTSIQVYTAPCGAGASLGCSTNGGAPATYAQLDITGRPVCTVETLYARVTSDGDLAGKFTICAKDISASAATGATCATAIPICGLPYVQTGLTTAGSGNDYDSLLAACHSAYMHGNDYLFSYTPAVNTCVTIAITNTGPNPGLFLVDGCPDLITTHCIADFESSTNSATINSVNLVGGVTYYIMVDENVVNGSMPFDISVTSSGGAPANDDCATAISLGTISTLTTCSWQTFSTNCATPSAVLNNPPCGNFIAGRSGDVWFSFTVNYTGSVVIDGRAGSVGTSNQNAALAVYAGGCGGAVYACDDNSGANNMPSVTIPVINGNTYYVRYWTVSPNNSGSFDLCIYSANGCTPPNDHPCSAVLIPLGGTAQGNNSCATSNLEPPNAAQCVVGTINTVWYKVVVPPSGSVHVRTHLLTLSDSQIGGYLFPTGCANASSSYVYKGCNDNGPTCSGFGTFNNYSDFNFTGLMTGDTLFIAVDGVGSATGTFDISAVDGVGGVFPPVPLQDCAAAQQVCSSSDIVVAQPGPEGFGNVCDLTGPFSCWGNGEYNSAWYQVTCNPGLLQFSVITGCSSDIDFAVWNITGITNACAQITAGTLPTTSCNYAAFACSTGCATPTPAYAFAPAISVVGTPQTYLIFLNNYNNSPTAGYTLTWMGSPIAASPSSITWTGTTDTLYETTTNWGDCGVAPACGVDAVVAMCPSGRMPTIHNNQSVRSLTINAGATLRLKAPNTLTVCGNFVNNGTFIAEAGSTVNFVGNANQTISGNLTGANSFSNMTITKTSPGIASLNSNIEVKQDFLTSNVTSVFSINGKRMYSGGNFTNSNGTTTFTGISGSTVEFNGAANQYFTNVNLPAMDFGSVTMNKTGGNLYLNGFNSIMNVDSILTLTSGNIVTTPALEVNVKLAAVAAITGHNVNSYIDGFLRRKIVNVPLGGSNDFPVGDSLVPNSIVGKGYELVNITFTSSTIISDLLCSFNIWPGVVPVGPVGPDFCAMVPIGNSYTTSYNSSPLYDNGYWSFTRTSAAFNGTYNITLYNTGGTNNAGGPEWTVATALLASPPLIAGSWFLTGTCFNPSTLAITKRVGFNSPVLSGGASSFNQLYATAQTNTVLPIELLYFTAEPKGEVVICKWETASEINNDYFDVERSTDGTTYEAIGRVKGFGQGTSTEQRSYSLIDHDLCEDIRYYRLKQVDIDGEYSYSESVAINCKRVSGIELYPNPANSTLSYQFTQNEKCNLVASFVDVTGRIVKSENIKGEKGINVITSRIDDLAAGAYYLRISKEGSENYVELQARFFKN